MSKGIFSKPLTFKKVAMYILMLAGLAALGFVARTAYVIMNPAAAFPQAVATVEASPQATLAPTQTPPPKATAKAPAETPEPTPDPQALLLSQADLDFLKDRVTILLVGADQSPERLPNREQYRSDVLMLITIDFSNKKVDMLSIPRDTMARIYNTKGRWKINACFEHGGGIEKDSFLYAKETISMLLGGVPVQYHMGVTMDGIKRVVDAMGGVDYDVDVEIRLNGRKLETGQQHLDGQQVLDYCRARKGISTDLGRIDRQQRMMFTIFDQLKSRDQLVNLPNIMNSVKGDLYTNLNFEQIAALTVFASGIDLNNIERHTLKGEYMEAYNASFFVLDQEYKCQKVKDIFGVTIKPDKDFDVSKVRRDVRASSSQAALARARSFLNENQTALSLEQQAQIYSQIDELEAAVSAGDYADIDSAISGLDGSLDAPAEPPPAESVEIPIPNDTENPVVPVPAEPSADDEPPAPDALPQEIPTDSFQPLF